MEECKVAKFCIYGSGKYSNSRCCDYIGKTGKSRVVNNPDGEIKNGKCKMFKERSNARTRTGAQNKKISK